MLLHFLSHTTCWQPSPKMDKRFTTNNINDPSKIPQEAINTIPTDSITYQTYLQSESTLDQLTSQRLSDSQLQLLSLSPTSNHDDSNEFIKYCNNGPSMPGFYSKIRVIPVMSGRVYERWIRLGYSMSMSCGFRGVYREGGGQSEAWDEDCHGIGMLDDTSTIRIDGRSHFRPPRPGRMFDLCFRFESQFDGCERFELGCRCGP
eukprot:CCRYP_003243-RA/>CCRYP_003243-RA protein AED:0.30 eAED:0.30 QI:10/1/1/1/0/0/4/764/203